MKDYTVLEALKRTAASKIENAFERGYEQGYQDGQKDSQKSKGEAVANEIIACKEAYQKGLKHGQELRVKETECAEACGMRRAWDLAKKLVLSEESGGLSYTEIRDIFGEFSYPEVFKDFTASEAIKKVEEYEKKQKEQTQEPKNKVGEKICGSCNCIRLFY